MHAPCVNIPSFRVNWCWNSPSHPPERSPCAGSVSSELHNAELESKIVERVKAYRFEAKDVDTITTTKPIEFFPS